MQLHCSALGQFAMADICENWFSLVNSCIYHACNTDAIYLVLPYSMDFKAPRELWNPLRHYQGDVIFILSKGPVNLWHDRKAQK